MQFLKNLSKKALPFLFKKSKSIPSECPVIEQIIPTEPTKDKIIFQRNSISTKSSVECSTNALAQVNSKIVDHTPGMNNIIVECDMQSIGHLQSLCQFFEISQNVRLLPIHLQLYHKHVLPDHKYFEFQLVHILNTRFL